MKINLLRYGDGRLFGLLDSYFKATRKTRFRYAIVTFSYFCIFRNPKVINCNICDPKPCFSCSSKWESISPYRLPLPYYLNFRHAYIQNSVFSVHVLKSVRFAFFESVRQLSISTVTTSYLSSVYCIRIQKQKVIKGNQIPLITQSFFVV